ncbi:hypothetical protein BV898_05507 [Hypsibius exemplaris]|uniref:N-acetyltransferase domain-containing protein n=1 Tax=Hypsibius exemplaris TaxID=2072580 RepID=A0A1W0WZD1_HYPEX|nr:hypothetical protein BV898_05507 [Hypsibius exemplaris]
MSANTAFPQVVYRKNVLPPVSAVLDLYRSAPLAGRPDDQVARMYENSNLVITAWDGDLLVGVARSVTDFSFCCYVSDLAIRKEYQKGGVGRELLRLTKEAVGDACPFLLLLASEVGETYYPKIGFSRVDAFIMRKEGYPDYNERSFGLSK